MLFNSYEFLFAFLPIVLVGFFLIGARWPMLAALWLALASLVFYSWWDVSALPLLLGSIVMNYLFGGVLARQAGTPLGKAVLWVAVAANLGLLGFFKYADFFIASVNEVLRLEGSEPLALLGIVLPIGISFYTFTQIAFLVDCYQGKVRERRFVHYLLFVTYFPHLIAGPVLHHAQMMPQFAREQTYRLDWQKIAAGLTIFTIGLAKKLIIADPLGGYADQLFDAVRDGAQPGMGSAWGGVLAYTYQIYFDFSGYSDMAIGLSLLFGVTLPINFNAPYRAESISDFWRRWHISLSTFLRDYLYIPLGGNRFGAVRRYANLLTTMVLGGLWHGANWTFILWGAIHGLLLMVNHWWRASPFGHLFDGPIGRRVAWAMTFLCVCLAWVPFRAHSIHDAFTIYDSMIAVGSAAGALGALDRSSVLLIGGLLTAFVLTWLSPSLLRDMAAKQGMERPFGLVYSVGLGTLIAVCIGLLARNSPFLYFQF